MAQTHSGHKRIRKFYGKIREVAEMPNLIEVQKSSYDLFLKSGDQDTPQDGEGLKGVFQSVFPIRDFNETATLEFVRYELEAPKYDVDECMQRDMTYAAPLKVTLRLIVFEVDEETGSRSVKDIKEQDVYMGDMPLMTPNGTFVVNGTERVIVSQMHRSPGVFFDHDKGKTHSSGKLLFACRIIPYRGSWLDFEFDAKDIVFARIDRRRKLPVTTLLYALGLDQEGIMDAYYNTVEYKLEKNRDYTLSDTHVDIRLKNVYPKYVRYVRSLGQDALYDSQAAFLAAMTAYPGVTDTYCSDNAILRASPFDVVYRFSAAYFEKEKIEHFS